MPRGVYPRRAGLTRNTPARASLLERFKTKVEKHDADCDCCRGCWHWTGFIDKAGYGRIREGGRDTPVLYAHRVSYEHYVGPIPEGLHLDHVLDRGCIHRHCVNPEHLEPVSPRENTLRGEAGEVRRTGRCSRGHDQGVYGYVAPNGRRSCLECKRLNEAGVAPMLERDLQRGVLELARLLGWRVGHFRAAKTSKGWRTPVEADGEGFPDLCCVRDRTVWIELKSDTGKLSEKQRDWLRALANAGAEVYLLRPRHLELIAAVLAARAAPLGPLTTPAAKAARQQLVEELRKEIA